MGDGAGCVVLLIVMVALIGGVYMLALVVQVMVMVSFICSNASCAGVESRMRMEKWAPERGMKGIERNGEKGPSWRRGKRGEQA